MLYFISSFLKLANLLVCIALIILILINLPDDIAKLRNKQIRFRFRFWKLHWFSLIFLTLSFFNPLVLLVGVIDSSKILMLLTFAYNLSISLLAIKFFIRFAKGGRNV